jgi:hypothetical protein
MVEKEGQVAQEAAWAAQGTQGAAVVVRLW